MYYMILVHMGYRDCDPDTADRHRTVVGTHGTVKYFTIALGLC